MRTKNQLNIEHWQTTQTLKTTTWCYSHTPPTDGGGQLGKQQLHPAHSLLPKRSLLQETHTLYVPSSNSFDPSARPYKSHKGTKCGFRWQIMPNLETLFQCVPEKSKMGNTVCDVSINLIFKNALKIIEWISAFKTVQKLRVQWWTLHTLHEKHIGDKCYSAAWT